MPHAILPVRTTTHRHLRAPARVLTPPNEIPSEPAGFQRSTPLAPLPVTATSGLSIAPTVAGPGIKASYASSCLKPSIPQPNTARGWGSALSPLLDATTAVRPMYVRPGLQYATAGIFATAADGVNGRPGGLVAGVPLGDAGAPVLGGLLDSGSGALSVQHTQGGLGEAGTFILGDGFVSVGGAGTVLRDGMLSSYGGAIMGWRDYIGVAGTWFDVNTATGQIALVGASIARSADRSVADLGPCSPSVAAELARSRGLAMTTPLRRVEITRSRGFAASLRGMFGHLFISVQGRVGYSRSKNATYRAVVSEDTAKDVLFERRGFRRFFRDKARALGWASDCLPIPDPSKPAELPLGDEITVMRSGAWIVSVLAGNLAAWAGVQVTFKGDVSIRVRKLGEHVVEVMYTPTKVKSFALVATSALGIQATLDRAPAKAFRQVFTFDLHKAEAREAYHNALEGRLPGALHLTGGRRDGAKLADDLFEAVQEEAGLLPAGVTRSYAHGLQALQTRRGGGLHLYLIPRFLLPKGWEPGWMRHRIKIHETEAIAGCSAKVFTDSRVNEVRSEKGWHGLHSRRAAAIAKHEVKEDGTTVKTLALHITMSYGRMGVRSLNRKVIAKVNRKFNTHLRDHAPIDGSRAWLLEIYRTVTDDDLNQMAHDASSRASVAMHLKMATLSRRAGVDARAIKKFLQNMASAQHLDGRIRVAESLVQDYGISGIAVLHGLLGDDRTRMEIKLTQSNYQTAVTEAVRLDLKYSGPKVRSRKSKKEQVKELAGGCGRLQLAYSDIGANSIMGKAERARLLGEVDRMHGRLKAISTGLQ